MNAAELLFQPRCDRTTAAILLFVCLIACGTVDAQNDASSNDSTKTFYVDAEGGHDGRDGLSEQTAWQSLQRVNTADLQPGDSVRFKCGGLWRGSLVPVSGDENAPVTYTSYGSGPKPTILGSRPRNRAEDWCRVDENTWATLPMEYRLDSLVLDLGGSQWRHHQEAGANVRLAVEEDADGPFVRVTCTASGTAPNHIQIWGPELPVEQDTCLLLKFRARSNRPFRFPGVSVLENKPPWTRFGRTGPADRDVGSQWQDFQLAFQIAQSSNEGRLHINLGGILPADAVFDFRPQSIHAATPNIADPLDVDVGNIIFDDGRTCGWKKWSLQTLEEPYDYFYDAASKRVFLHTSENPATTHESIELAMARHVVNQSGVHHVIYDGLAVRYGAAHGFGGGNTHHLVIRNCDLSYIGGAHQFTREDGRPVRYGNAIEFWGAAHDNLVEGCRIWEVYDAALTNQGRGPDSRQVNITYRNNFIRNAEYSFEYWNNPETAFTENIRFVNNTCVDAGTVWSHEQRPDQNGSHLMFYSNTAQTSGIEVKYNIFYNVTEWGSRYDHGWKPLPDMDWNLWYSEKGVMVRWFGETVAGFKDYQATTGLDAHSRFADPRFIDPANGDYRLAPDSPVRTLRPDNGPVGAEMRWNGSARNNRKWQESPILRAVRDSGLPQPQRPGRQDRFPSRNYRPIPGR